jgi:hypothetical protein
LAVGSMHTMFDWLLRRGRGEVLSMNTHRCCCCGCRLRCSVWQLRLTVKSWSHRMGTATLLGTVPTPAAAAASFHLLPHTFSLTVHLCAFPSPDSPLNNPICPPQSVPFVGRFHRPQKRIGLSTPRACHPICTYSPSGAPAAPHSYHNKHHRITSRSAVAAVPCPLASISLPVTC